MKPLSFFTLLALLVMTGSSLAVDVLIRPQSADLQPDQGIQFETQVYQNTNQPVRNIHYNWSVIPNHLGTVSTDGYFMAGKKSGEGKIIVSAIVNGQKIVGTADIRIGSIESNPIEIEVKPERAQVIPGKKQTFQVIARSNRGISLRVRSVRWFVEPKSLGTISQSGVFTASNRDGIGQVIALAEIDDKVYRAAARVLVTQGRTAAMSGKVLDPTSSALEGAVITIYKLGPIPYSQKTRSDANGAFAFTDLLPGYYVAHTRAEGFVPQYYDHAMFLSEATPIKITDGDSITGIQFDLETGARIEGTVTDENDTPLGDVHLMAVNPLDNRFRMHTLSNEDGSYQISGLRSGSYIVTAHREGYSDLYYDQAQTRTDADLLHVNDQVVSGIDFSLSLTSAITGTLTNTAGEPIEGARIGVFKLQLAYRHTPDFASSVRTTRTLEDGSFGLSLKPGFYLLYAAASGYDGLWYDEVQDPEQATPIQVLDGEHSAVSLVLDPLGKITGSVVDSSSGDPVAGAHVRVLAEQRPNNRKAFHTTTDENGLFTVENLPAGDYLLQTGADGYIPEFWQDASTPKKATQIEVNNNETVEDIDVTLQIGAQLAGTITDFESGIALTNAVISIYQSETKFRRTTRTDEDGKYELNGLPTGSYTLMADARGYLRQWYEQADRQQDASEFVLDEGESTTIDFALQQREMPGGQISGIAYDDSTELPITGAHILAMPLTFSRPIRTVSGLDGTYELEGLRAGIYFIVCRAAGYVGEYYEDAHHWSRATPVRISNEGIMTTIDFGLTPQPEGAYRLAGHVHNEDGSPVDGALVVAETEEGVIAATITGENGAYTLSDLPTGSYSVTASVTQGTEGTLSDASTTLGNGVEQLTADITVTNQTTDVEQTVGVPEYFSLNQNYPNPFNPSTEISFALPQQADITLTIYNVLGQPVRILANGTHEAGQISVTWDGRNENGHQLASGMYFYRLKAQSQSQTFQQTRRMVLTK